MSRISSSCTSFVGSDSPVAVRARTRTNAGPRALVASANVVPVVPVSTVCTSAAAGRADFHDEGRHAGVGRGRPPQVVGIASRRSRLRYGGEPCWRSDGALHGGRWTCRRAVTGRTRHQQCDEHAATASHRALPRALHATQARPCLRRSSGARADDSRIRPQNARR